MLGVPISTRRIKCALLALHALHNAMHRYHGQKEQSWVATLEEYIATEKTD
jgi:NifU-like protein involved in Fe-S cluster formation